MADYIQCFYDPNTNNQVMAFYVDCFTGDVEAWTNQGFIECLVPEAHHGAVMSMGRNCVLTFEDDELVLVQPNTNAELTEHEQAHEAKEAEAQAAEQRLKDLEDKIAALEAKG